MAESLNARQIGTAHRCPHSLLQQRAFIPHAPLNQGEFASVFNSPTLRSCTTRTTAGSASSSHEETTTASAKDQPECEEAYECFLLADDYRWGTGRKSDPRRALRLNVKACKLRYADACYKIGSNQGFVGWAEQSSCGHKPVIWPTRRLLDR